MQHLQIMVCALPVTILKQAKPATGQQIIAPEIAHSVVRMLESVVQEHGTGRRARVNGYRVAGKTGTAKKAVAGGYGNEYIASFAGMAPASDPELVLVVLINEPKGDRYYGGEVAAPVFAEVMSGALQLLNIRPDAVAEGSIKVAQGRKTMQISLHELLKPWRIDAPQRVIKGIRLDSRAIQPGDCFVALPGHKVDGRHYIDSAIRNGAVAVLFEHTHRMYRARCTRMSCISVCQI